MTDFLNNLEMSLHKLGFIEQDIENIRQNQSLLDFCETVCNRESETQLSLHRANRLIAKAKLLQTHLTEQQSQQTIDMQLNANLAKDSCKEMLIRLAEVVKSMKVNEAVLTQIKQS